MTTYYVGGYYELQVEGTDETEAKYYMAAGRRIAMRTVTGATNILHWLISDHLSSTTIIADESGTIVSEMKYSAFGEIRDINGTSPTDYLYTGQRKEVEFGLSFYNSRWYDASLGHFISADTLIPEPGDSQAWDRYVYVLNNPLKYIDPSGHYGKNPWVDDFPLIDGDESSQKNIYDQINSEDHIGYYQLKDVENYLIRQGHNDCGATASAMLANWWEGDPNFVTKDEIGQWMMDKHHRLPWDLGIDAKGATSPFGLTRWFEEEYSKNWLFQESGVKFFNTYEDVIDSLHETNNPVQVIITGLDNDGHMEYMHYLNVVGYSYDLSELRVMDPMNAKSITTYSMSKFSMLFQNSYGIMITYDYSP